MRPGEGRDAEPQGKGALGRRREVPAPVNGTKQEGGFPGVSEVKNPPDAGDADSIPGLGRCPGGENDNPLQYACLENSRDRGAWKVKVHAVTKSRT